MDCLQGTSLPAGHTILHQFHDEHDDLNQRKRICYPRDLLLEESLLPVPVPPRCRSDRWFDIFRGGRIMSRLVHPVRRRRPIRILIALQRNVFRVGLIIQPSTSRICLVGTERLLTVVKLRIGCRGLVRMCVEVRMAWGRNVIEVRISLLIGRRVVAITAMVVAVGCHIEWTAGRAKSADKEVVCQSGQCDCRAQAIVR